MELTGTCYADTGNHARPASKPATQCPRPSGAESRNGPVTAVQACARPAMASSHARSAAIVTGDVPTSVLGKRTILRALGLGFHRIWSARIELRRWMAALDPVLVSSPGVWGFRLFIRPKRRRCGLRIDITMRLEQNNRATFFFPPVGWAIPKYKIFSISLTS